MRARIWGCRAFWYLGRANVAFVMSRECAAHVKFVSKRYMYVSTQVLNGPLSFVFPTFLVFFFTFWGMKEGKKRGQIWLTQISRSRSQFPATCHISLPPFSRWCHFHSSFSLDFHLIDISIKWLLLRSFIVKRTWPDNPSSGYKIGDTFSE